MPGSQVIVGLGNPGPEYVASRHNVGHAVVDRLGARLGARFRLQGPAHVAEVPCREPALYLAKLLAVMNVSGPSVGRLLRLLALEPAALILVYDDLDLPSALTHAEAIAWNLRYEEESGLVVGPDGRATYTGLLRERLSVFAVPVLGVGAPRSMYCRCSSTASEVG